MEMERYTKMKKYTKYIIVSIIPVIVIILFVVIITRYFGSNIEETKPTQPSPTAAPPISSIPSTGIPSPLPTVSYDSFAYDFEHINEKFNLRYPSYLYADIDHISGGRPDIILSSDSNIIEIDFGIASEIAYEDFIELIINNYGNQQYYFSYEQAKTGSLNLKGAYQGDYRIYSIESSDIDSSTLYVIQISSTDNGYGFLTIWDKTNNNKTAIDEILNSIQYINY